MFCLPPRALVVVLALPQKNGSELLLLFSGCSGKWCKRIVWIFFNFHACVVVDLPPSPLRPQPRLVVVVVVVVGLSRGVGHPFSKDPL